MMKQKIFGIVLVTILAATSAAIFNTGCYDDSQARVTIHLERNDLAFNNIKNNRRFIDRVLEFFSTPAEAMSTDWVNNHGDLTLTITSADFDDMVFVIPASATEYSVSLPPSDGVTFTVISEFNTPVAGRKKTWGGHTKTNISSGGVDLTIKMIPMTWVALSAATMATILVSWEFIDPAPSNATSYIIYRSTSLNGPYTSVYTTPSISTNSYANGGLVSGTLYYYKIAVQGSDGIGVMSDSASFVAPF